MGDTLYLKLFLMIQKQHSSGNIYILKYHKPIVVHRSEPNTLYDILYKLISLSHTLFGATWLGENLAQLCETLLITFSGQTKWYKYTLPNFQHIIVMSLDNVYLMGVR